MNIMVKKNTISLFENVYLKNIISFEPNEFLVSDISFTGLFFDLYKNIYNYSLCLPYVFEICPAFFEILWEVRKNILIFINYFFRVMKIS